MESLSENQTTETVETQQKNEYLLKLLYSPTLTDIGYCNHISCVTSDRAWVCDGEYNIILTNTTGDTIHRVKDSCFDLYGLHTVNSGSELIYIDKKK